LNIGPALILNQNPIFEMASMTYFKNNYDPLLNRFTPCPEH
jgi:hypothetical protein